MDLIVTSGKRKAAVAKATLKDGLLTIQIPKDAKVKTKVIKINEK